MTNESIRSALEAAGMQEKEVTVYTALLASGPTLAASLAKRTGLARSTAQFTCQQLVRRGFARMIQKGNSYLFSPEPPDKLLVTIDQERTGIEDRRRKIETAMGDLRTLAHPSSLIPRIKVFEGREDILRGYKEVADRIEPRSSLLSYVDVLGKDNDPHKIWDPIDAIYKRIQKKQVDIKFICLSSPAAEDLHTRDKPGRASKILSLKSSGYPQEMMIFGDTMFVVSAEHSAIFGYLVENRNIVEMHRQLFTQLWKSL